MIATKTRGLERVRYFAGQLMTAEDMRSEQDYFVERTRRHNRLFHGWGILCGLEVQPAPTTEKPWQVCIYPGAACCPTGDEVHVPAPVVFDLARIPSPEDDECTPCPCPQGPPLGSRAETTPHYLVIRYLCRPSRPVRTGHADCGCGEGGCETSRYRDDFEITLLDELPVPYDEKSRSEEVEWLGRLRAAAGENVSLFRLPIRPCSPSSVGPWIVLAAVEGDLSSPPPGETTGGLDALKANLLGALSFDLRRLLPRAQDLMAAFRP